MQVIVAGWIKMAGDAAPTLQSATGHIDAALAEKGCLAYEWAVYPDKPDTILVFERWDSVDTLIAHLNAEPYFAMGGHLEAAGIAGADVLCHSVTGSQNIYGNDGLIAEEIFGQRTR
ncbi:antibiotic biosynthesis monooxygenase [Croceicoccus ponticola]|uniref:Antibiotic biosynthesis monooxygenase n=1 Tax=Croceicoccus ponticola TaxID=2217664 RepID=A0A437GXI6_9SPHN|nr:antibiotic biosynthesis monooxygenase [Croceicoccus ponticola]RVQ67115.1 antibiotic biosynthesis monooxygenase [Croceicoccus ponticola]